MPLTAVQTPFEVASNGHPPAVRAALAGLRFELARFGRRVTGTVHLADGTNPAGLSACRVEYTAPASRDWTADRERDAVIVGAYWFHLIGNIDRVDRPLMGHIVQRLKANRTAEGLVIATREYARSDWNREKGVWKRAGRFFTEADTVLTWLTKSPEWRAHSARHAARAKQPPPNRAATVREWSPEPSRDRKGVVNESSGKSSGPRPRRPGNRPSPITLTDAELRAEYRLVLADRQTYRQALAVHRRKQAATWRRAYESLTPEAQRRLYAEAEKVCATGPARTDGTAAINYDSDEFRVELHRQGWLIATASDPEQAAEFAIPTFRAPPSTTNYAPNRTEDELRRRACAGVDYPPGPRSTWPDARRRAVAAGEQQLMEDWLIDSAPSSRPRGRAGCSAESLERER